MIRPELRRIAAQVRARLQSGKALTWRDVFKRRRSPILDPITAAMLGYTRRGAGWVKKNPVSTSQDAMK